MWRFYFSWVELKTFLLSLISVHSGLRRQIYQKVKVGTLDQCADWSQIFDQKDKGTVLLSPFWCHYPTTFPCSNSPMETLGKEFMLQLMLERILIHLLFLLLFLLLSLLLLLLFVHLESDFLGNLHCGS